MTDAAKPNIRGNSHTCHAEGCEVHVPPRMFMCKPHWYALPMAKRALILSTYQPGQEKLDDVWPSGEYLAAAMDAVDWLAEHGEPNYGTG